MTNLLEHLDIVTNLLDKGFGVDVVHLDFEKAFDWVPHKRLILKLKCIGIHGDLLNWCISFLNQRKQRVLMGICISDGRNMYSVYVWCSSGICVFADDTKIPSVNIKKYQGDVLQNDVCSIGFHNGYYFWIS